MTFCTLAVVIIIIIIIGLVSTYKNKNSRHYNVIKSLYCIANELHDWFVVINCSLW